MQIILFMINKNISIFFNYYYFLIKSEIHKYLQLQNDFYNISSFFFSERLNLIDHILPFFQKTFCYANHYIQESNFLLKKFFLLQL